MGVVIKLPVQVLPQAYKWSDISHLVKDPKPYPLTSECSKGYDGLYLVMAENIYESSEDIYSMHIDGKWFVYQKIQARENSVFTDVNSAWDTILESKKL
jgi:hypothetical protein